jgi:L-aminopeptidase/D-esterase-like protein
VRGRLTLTAVRGVRVGCAEDPAGETGVTAVVFDRPVPTVVEVRGPASATFDTHSLGLDATFGRRDALFLSGGSVYGLDAARGVRGALLLRGRGEPVFGRGVPVPRIAGAALYDLPPGPVALPDYLPLGFAAADDASGEPLPAGRAGAGRGARVCKYRGPERARPGGQASAAAALGGAHTLGVLVVFNSVGAIRDWPGDRWLATARGGGLPSARPERRAQRGGAAGTTLAVLATDLPLERRTLYALAGHVHDAIARTVLPAHTATEGDLVFAASTAPALARPPVERRPGELADRVGLVAEGLVVEAARRLFA